MEPSAYFSEEKEENIKNPINTDLDLLKDPGDDARRILPHALICADVSQ
jgi:hypothetical protein